MQIPWPIDDLTIRIMRLLGAERRPSNQAFKHNRSHTPPIASEIITLPTKDFGSDVIGRTHRRVGELSTRFTPGIDLRAVADCQLDLVEVHRTAVAAAIGAGTSTGEELLVI